MVKKVLFFGTWGLIFTFLALYGFIEEATPPIGLVSSILNGSSAFMIFSPSVSLLVTLAGYPFANIVNKKLKRLSYLMAFACPVIFNILGGLILEVHYGASYLQLMMRLFLIYWLLINLFIGGLSLFIYYIYCKFIRKV